MKLNYTIEDLILFIFKFLYHFILSIVGIIGTLYSIENKTWDISIVILVFFVIEIITMIKLVILFFEKVSIEDE